MSDELNKSLISTLSELGLTPKEIRIYTNLLKHGPSTIVDISKVSGIKRTTAHNNVDELIAKGLVSQIKIGGRRKVVAEDPDNLEKLVERKRGEIELLNNALPDLVKSLKSLVEDQNSPISLWVKYYEGLPSLSSLYNEVVESEDVIAMVDAEDVLNNFPENKDKFSKPLSEGTLEMWEINITEHSKMGHANPLGNLPNYHYKEMQKGGFLPVDILVFSGKVLFIDLYSSPATGVLVENKTIASAMSTILKSLWGSL